MNCLDCEKDLVFYLYGELPAETEEAVEAHLDACPECRASESRLSALHRAVEAERMEPSLELLSSCRQGLAAALCNEVRQPAAGWRQWFASAGLSAWSWRLAGCAALMAVGFFAARLDHGSADFSAVHQIEPLSNGRVRIVLQDAVSRELSGKLDEQRVHSLLLSAARTAPDPAVRVDSLDLLRGRLGDSDVRNTLLAALRDDPDDGVRMRALDSLRPLAAQSDVRAVLLRVLREDRNAMVRAHAVNVLTHGDAPASDLAGALQELMQREENLDVRREGQRVLRSMNASLETF